MNYNNIEDNQFVGRLLEGIRRSRDFTQMHVAKELGIPQGTLSKVESGQLELSARLWHRFCSYMDVPLDTIVKGYLDEGKKIPKPKSIRCDRKRYKLLMRYGGDCYWNVRGVNPFIHYEKMLRHESHFQVNLNRKKIPSSYFLALDNPVTLSLLEDAAPSRIEDASHFIDFFTNEFQSRKFHGDFHDEYIKSKHPFNAVKKFISHSSKYACDYQRSLLKESHKSLLIRYQNMASKTLDDYFPDYSQYFLEQLCLYGMETKRNLEVNKMDEKENILFEIKIA